jgi:hypothetical protein
MRQTMVRAGVLLALLGLASGGCAASTPDPIHSDPLTADATVLSTPGASLVAASPTVGADAVSDDRMAVIRRHIAAVNAKNTVAFVATFLPEAVFDPGGNFQASSSLLGNSQPLADPELVEAWMGINRAWGFEADVIACNQDPAARIEYGYGAGQGDPMVVNCEVAARWRGLSLEITERWSYEFHGSRIGHWGFELLDLNPTERELPLGVDGLQAWEAWLAAGQPASAARLLNPRISQPPDCDGCEGWWEALAPGDPERAARLAPLLSSAENGWAIQGHHFWPNGLVPYDPMFADEIERSIREFLNEVP